MHIVIMTTDRCNAACTHCSTSCGPQRDVHLPRETIMRTMAEAADQVAADETLDFCFSGGEPFLDFELLHELVAYGHQLGASITCVSNAYWASSQPKATDLLKRLKNAGLNALAVSSSSFHEQFIKRSRVQRALATAQALGLETHLKFVSTATDPHAGHPMVLWAQQAGLDYIQVIPLMPTIRDEASLPEAEFERADALPQGPCPAPVMTLRETGQTYSCCTPGAHNDFFALGNAAQASFAALRRAFYYGGIQRVVREQGPAYFARAIRAQGQGDRLRPAYGGVCDLCTHISQDPAMARVAQKAAKDYAIATLKDILAPAA